MPELIGVILAAHSHDWIIELFELIDLRGRHQAAGSAAGEAALHYDMAARILHGPYACLNFPPEASDHILLSTSALAKINCALFGERIDWLTAMMAQNDTIRMLNENVQHEAEAA